MQIKRLVELKSLRECFVFYDTSKIRNRLSFYYKYDDIRPSNTTKNELYQYPIDFSMDITVIAAVSVLSLLPEIFTPL